jgi:single-strand DNA-binding protein
MASDICAIFVIGRLTKDPELRHLPSGTAVLNMRLAYTTREKRDEEWLDHSNYIDVTTWGRRAETCAQYLAKGRRIGVHGTLRWREWEAQDGSKRQAYEINAAEIQFLDSRQDDGRDGGGREEYGGSAAEAYQGASTAETYREEPGGEFQSSTPSDDDIPF